MILGNEAVKIGSYLFSQHIAKLDTLGSHKKEHLVPSAEITTRPSSQKSGEPILICSQEKIESLRNGLSEGHLPLGRLGVQTEEMFLAHGINESSARTQHDEALRHVKETCPWMFDLLTSLTKVFIPVGCPEKYKKAGFSSNLAKGFVFYWYCDRYEGEIGFETAVDYVHEASHQLTFLLNAIDPMIKGDPKKPVYSGIKGCERPAILSLHGAIALGYMSLFRAFHYQVNQKYVFNSEEKKKDEAKKLGATLKELTKNCEFTDVGNQVVRDLQLIYKKVS